MGIFITFEGVDGTGKTTQVDIISRKLSDKFSGTKTIVQTRAPGATRIGKRIRELVMNPENKEICSETEILLMAADMAQMTKEIIAPAFNDHDKIIISDRFFDSTYAYQGGGRGHDTQTLLNSVRIATGGIVPDITILLDFSAKSLEDATDSAISRMESSPKTKARFELEHKDFFKRVISMYRKLAASMPDRIFIVNAYQPIENVSEDIMSIINSKI